MANLGLKLSINTKAGRTFVRPAFFKTILCRILKNYILTEDKKIWSWVHSLFSTLALRVP